MERLLIGSLIAFSLTSFACTAPTEATDDSSSAVTQSADDPSGADDRAPLAFDAPKAPSLVAADPATARFDAPAAPAASWLTERMWISEARGAAAHSYLLEPGGTGFMTSATERPDLPSRTDGSWTQATIDWSATATTLTLGDASYPLVFSPNCRILQIGNNKFTAPANRTCPLEIPALTVEERGLVGLWEYRAEEASAWATLTIEADRNVSFAGHRSFATIDGDLADYARQDYFTVGADHVLRGVDAAGAEEMTFDVSLDGATLTAPGGMTLTRK